MDFADLIKADYTETSAMDGKSVELMFDLLATRIYDELIAPNVGRAREAREAREL